MYWIEFKSEKPGLELAEYLAKFIYPGVPVDEGVPFRGYSNEWWELSRANDHKLDEKGNNTHVYRDRYAPPDRMERVEKALLEIGATDIRRV